MTECEVRLSGSGGQGLILSAGILAEALIREGRCVSQSQSYEPTSRGGLSRSDLVISDCPADYPLVTELDYLVILDQCAVEASDGMIKDDAVVVVDTRHVTDPPQGDFRVIQLPVIETATAVGNRRVANIVALGAMAELSGLCSPEALKDAVRARVPAALRDLNVEALARGRALAGEVENA